MSRIRPAKFVHVVYRTRRFEQMLQIVFDAKIQHQNPALAFLTYDGATCRACDILPATRC